MSAAPPPVDTPATPTTLVKPGVTATLVPTLALFTTSFGGIFAFIFAIGAAVLSYKTYGSYPWAILDFFFPYLYYPYYALVLHQAPPATTTMFGGKKSVLNLLKMKW